MSELCLADYASFKNYKDLYNERRENAIYELSKLIGIPNELQYNINQSASLAALEIYRNYNK